MSQHGYGFDSDKAAEILRRLSEGETLVAICKTEGMPTRQTVGNWRRGNKDFDTAYYEAMEQGCHALLDETLAIADDREGDYRTDKDGNEVFDSEHVQRAKLRIWARHELIKRKRPDLFSDKQQHEHSGPGGGPIPTTITVVGVEPAK